MPADKGVRLDDRQRIANSREQPIETNEYHSVDGAEREFLWSSSPQNVNLLPQRPNGLVCATPFAPRTSSFFAGEASQATVSGSRRQLRLDERGAVVLAIVLVLIMLRCDEALDREVQRPFLVVERLVMIVVHRQVHRGEYAMYVAVILIERQR